MVRHFVERQTVGKSKRILRKEELHELRTEGWRNVADAVIFWREARGDEKEAGKRRQNR